MSKGVHGSPAHKQLLENLWGCKCGACNDISQGKLTEAWSSKLFDILETRISNGLPTLWTCQISIAELKDKIIRQNSGDVAQAEAITRRLSQHSLVLRA